MLERYEEVWIRMIALEKAFFWEKVIYGDFYSLFHRYGVSIQIHPLFYIMPYEGLCVLYSCKSRHNHDKSEQENRVHIFEDVLYCRFISSVLFC